MKNNEENEKILLNENNEKEKKFLEEKNKLLEENKVLKEENEKLKEITKKVKEDYDIKFKKIKKYDEIKGQLTNTLNEIKKYEDERS